MTKNSRSSVMGFHTLKNKVNRNAFDLSHRHMFTSQFGELLPVFVQWCNPNETFKLSFDSVTRTAPLNTAAFTRLRENIQYFFVPFQSLWRYFEQNVNNMTLGQAGQQIGLIASSPSSSQRVTTDMPYINFTDLQSLLKACYNQAVSVLSTYYSQLSNKNNATITDFYDYVSNRYSVGNPLVNSIFNDVFSNGQYRYVALGKLLMSLGYGNFSSVITHDLFSSAFDYMKTQSSFVASKFLASPYALTFSSTFISSPNLSVFPLLAYHKIVNDFYRYRSWQSYESWTCNVDFMTPGTSLDYGAFFKTSNVWNNPQRTIFDLEFSNLPFDYFNAVLPRAQYGDEAAVVISDGGTNNFSDLRFTPTLPIAGEVQYHGDQHLLKGLVNASGDTRILDSGTINIGSTDLKVSSLRSAIALQKYKEIQNANDSSFESQVLAHFGIKPSCDVHRVHFIGGSDSTITIDQQVNSNFGDGGMPDVKAIGQSGLHSSCKFTSDTYGIIIGIYRCTPQLDYAHIGIDRNLFKTDASDFPLPELDSVGMQTQYRCEVACPDINSGSTKFDMSSTYGYAPRFCELKTSFDRYDGGFFSAFSDWVVGQDLSFLSRWANRSYSEMDVASLFLCRPQMLYPIFQNQWSGTANDDKLLVASVNSCIAIRPYSVHGLPYSN